MVVHVLNEAKEAFLKNKFLKNKNLQRIVLGFAVFIILTGILAFDFIPETIDIEAGKPSPETVKASRTVEFIDAEKTKEQKEAVEASVEEVYKRDVTAVTRVQENITNIFKQVKNVKAELLSKDDDKVKPTNEKELLEASLAALKEKAGYAISEKTLTTCLTISDDEIKNLEEKTISIVTQVMSRNIMEEDLVDKKMELDRMAATLTLSPAQIEAATEIGGAFIEPNYYYDVEQTQKLRNEAVAKVEPYTIKKVAGEIIVREGEIVTDEQIKILAELGLLKKGIEVNKIIGTILLILGMIFIFAVYIYKFHKEIYDNVSYLFLLGILLVSVTLIAKIITPFFPSYLIPVAAIVMLTTILLNPRIGIIMLILSSIITGQILGNNLQYLTVSILGGLFAIYLVSDVVHRGDLARAGIWLGSVLAGLCFVVSLISNINVFGAFKNIGWGLAGGISSAILAIGALPFLESGFHITTDIKLLELANSTQPLLRKLMIDAPGTYNHSVMVGNLAEAAAEEIGANPLLARVGSYYHDIGKLKRPFFFVENQICSENPHDKTNPNLSFLIINAHVKDGVEMAKKHRLPKEIIEIIEQHHGTSLITYFYHRAKKEESKHEVSEVEFRYSGEKPATKESAIIMIADSVEAAARTISKLSPARLEQLTRKIIQDKLNDGQLDKSNLTLNELNKVAESFTQTLSSIYHSRIEYPDLKVVSSSKGMLNYGNSNK
ncbi:HDIG domain-containing metalloprotein [Candidatus Oleimmundimicrobium sp.]|uniref:HD family phosphohydrolase n=1 Tax=Candidatus Oleimmundimicrobium sp. TaxID=3060597 RepID=UPI0027234A26|nr:HDIG domain-containing metalloprotein [Candidatus Oleimmundimicrobium sp.]MDO8885845.1 HDIG domain-containing protein [Candidatus Oleimmundimicrobium sp.]